MATQTIFGSEVTPFVASQPMSANGKPRCANSQCNLELHAFSSACPTLDCIEFRGRKFCGTQCLTTDERNLYFSDLQAASRQKQADDLRKSQEEAAQRLQSARDAMSYVQSPEGRSAIEKTGAPYPTVLQFAKENLGFLEGTQVNPPRLTFDRTRDTKVNAMAGRGAR